jgi:hypothetical protein
MHERSALQKLGKGELIERLVGSAYIVAKLRSKGWIEPGGIPEKYRITPAGSAALRARLPMKK